MKFADLHTHTPLCCHAAGTPEEYLASAKKAGLAYLGVSDHTPWPPGIDAWRMKPEEFPAYKNSVMRMKQLAEGLGVEVLYGLELDWIPGRMNEVADALKDEPFDYLIGSVHNLDGFVFDDPSQKQKWFEIGVDKIWDHYAEQLLNFVEQYDFQIIGHPDLPKKFRMYPSDLTRFQSAMRKVFDSAAQKGIALELNTAGLRKESREIYPSFELLKLAHDAGMPITLGSDAHLPSEVAYAFDKAVELAKAAGYKSALTFQKMRPIELPF